MIYSWLLKRFAYRITRLNLFLYMEYRRAERMIITVIIEIVITPIIEL